MVINTNNDNITFRGELLTIRDSALRIGDVAPKFKLSAKDFKERSSADFAGKVILISVVPSIDTSTCAKQTHHFDVSATKFNSDVQFITVSLDLPFAQERWCELEGIRNQIVLSDFKTLNFAKSFGVYITQLGFLTRAVFVIDQQWAIRHLEYVQNISDEPNYLAALDVVNQLI